MTHRYNVGDRVLMSGGSFLFGKQYFHGHVRAHAGKSLFGTPLYVMKWRVNSDFGQYTVVKQVPESRILGED